MEKETLEEEVLNKIKFVLSVNNDAQAIRILEQYSYFKLEGMYNEGAVRQAFRNGQESMYYSEMYGMDSELTEQDWFDKFKKQ
jgi:hypothetical protein